MKNLIAGLVSVTALMGLASLSGCNTVEGAGRDVEAAGQKVQEANCTSADSKSDPKCNK